VNSSYFVNAKAIVDRLLETDEFDPDPSELMGSRSMKNYERAHVERQRWQQFLPPGFKSVPHWSKPGHSSQFESEPVGNWKGNVTFYDNGGALMCAYYKVPAFSWASRDAKKTGFAWSGGADLEWVPHKGVASYWKRMLKMFKDTPDPWKARRIPHMPEINWRPPTEHP
jgi:hypothetical protein